jgi:hypothetical protein
VSPLRHAARSLSARLALVALACVVASGPLAGALGRSAHAQDAAGDDPLALRLAEEVARFGPEATPVAPFEAITFAESGSGSAFREFGVQPARCYTFAALAEADGADLDLHLYAEGTAVASDVATDSRPVITWCNPGFERVSLELRMYRGAGRAVWVALEAADASQADPLEAALWAAAGRFAQGYRPTSEPIRATLATGQSSTRAVLLASGRCFTVVSAASPTVEDLDLSLLDATGQVVDFDESRGAEPVLRYCTEAAGGEYTVTVHLVEGYGDAVIQVYSD